MLVKFMLSTKQPVKAAHAIKEAEANLENPEQAPLALAECCVLMGKGDEAIDGGE